jgi:AraC-like DNA-binding protein
MAAPTSEVQNKTLANLEPSTHGARRLMVSRQADAGNVSHKLGYKGASHVSRWYKHLFGAPPGRDAGFMQAIINSN